MTQAVKTSLSELVQRPCGLVCVRLMSARFVSWQWMVYLVLGSLPMLSSTAACGEWRPNSTSQEILTTIDQREVLFGDSPASIESQIQPITHQLVPDTPQASELDRVLPDSNDIVAEGEQGCCGVFEHSGSQLPWSRFDESLTPWEFLSNDFSVLLHNLDDDFVDFWQPKNILFTSAGLGLALGMRGSIDDDVRDYTREHPRRWGKFSETLGVMGNAEVQLAGIGLLYGYAYHSRDSELLGFTRLLFRSYSLTGLSSLAIKGIANTDRPSDRWNNGSFGFPSAHTSLSFAIAATVEEYYGPRAGIPAYLTASLIGWSRIDERDHDLSDVVFGAVLGYVIAKSVAGKELRQDSRIRISPWTDPVANTYGTMFEIDF